MGLPDRRDAPSAACLVGREADRTLSTVGEPGYLRISGTGQYVTPVTQEKRFPVRRTKQTSQSGDCRMPAGGCVGSTCG
jgi:hypothetical protein